MEKPKINVSAYLEQDQSSDYEVDFRRKSDLEYKRYVGIGGYCTNRDGIYIDFPPGDDPSMSEWREYFNSSNNAQILLTFHEFVMSYRETKDPQNYGFGQEIYMIIKAHE